MKNLRNKGAMPVIAMIGLGCLSLAAATHVQAGCGQYEDAKPTTTGWKRIDGYSGFRATTVMFSNDAQEAEPTAYPPYNDYAIVGLWNISMVARGNPGIKDGTEIDFGYQTWHSDGTELLNSGGRSPLSGDICTGVWGRTSYHHYRLNHVTLAWDPTGKVFVGPGNIKENIVVDDTRDRFSGDFEIIQYSLDGTTVLADIKGTVTGDRVKP